MVMAINSFKYNWITTVVQYYMNAEMRQSQTLKTYKLRDRSSSECEQTNKHVSKRNMEIAT